MQLREFQINFKDFICDLSAINFIAEPVAGLDIYKAVQSQNHMFLDSL